MKCEEGQILFISGLPQGESACTKGLGGVPRVLGVAGAAQPSGLPLPGH